MLTQTQQEKTERTFRLFDTDGDGRIGRSDFEDMASRIIEACGEQPNSPKARAVRGAYVNEWEQGFARQTGIGKEGTLTLDEFKRVADQFMTANEGVGYHQTVRPTIQAIVDVADKDGNGVLSREEFRALYSAIGIGGADAEAAFDNLDTDHNGSLSVDEVVAGWRAYYFDETQQSPAAL